MNNTEANNYFEAMMNSGQKPLHVEIAEQLKEQSQQEERPEEPRRVSQQKAERYSPSAHDVNAALRFNR